MCELTKIEIANLKRINTSLEVYRRQVASAESELKVIEDKIKKQFEQKMNELKSIIDFSKSEIDFWEAPVRARYGKSVNELLNGDTESSEEPEESQDDGEAVVDEETPKNANDIASELENPDPEDTEDKSDVFSDPDPFSETPSVQTETSSCESVDVLFESAPNEWN